MLRMFWGTGLTETMLAELAQNWSHFANPLVTERKFSCCKCQTGWKERWSSCQSSPGRYARLPLHPSMGSWSPWLEGRGVPLHQGFAAAEVYVGIRCPSLAAFSSQECDTSPCITRSSCTGWGHTVRNRQADPSQHRCPHAIGPVGQFCHSSLGYCSWTASQLLSRDGQPEFLQ